MSGMRRRGPLEDELIEQQALAMALHQQHKAQLRFERSLSHRDPATAPPRRSYSGKPSSGKLEYTRSASTRPRHSNDLLIDPQQLLNGTRVYTSSSSSPLLLLLTLQRNGTPLFPPICINKLLLLMYMALKAHEQNDFFLLPPICTIKLLLLMCRALEGHEQNNDFFLLPPICTNKLLLMCMGLEASTWAERLFLSSPTICTKLFFLMCIGLRSKHMGRMSMVSFFLLLSHQAPPHVWQGGSRPSWSTWAAQKNQNCRASIEESLLHMHVANSIPDSNFQKHFIHKSCQLIPTIVSKGFCFGELDKTNITHLQLDFLHLHKSFAWCMHLLWFGCCRLKLAAWTTFCSKSGTYWIVSVWC